MRPYGKEHNARADRCVCPQRKDKRTERQKHENGVSTLNIAKALMDGNTHPPTVYFPLIVHEAIMIEPTESESKDKLDEFVDTMINIANEAKINPEKILSAPHTTPVKKIDEVTAARKPDLNYIN